MGALEVSRITRCEMNFVDGVAGPRHERERRRLA